MPKLTLIFKGQAISVHTLKEGSTFIGRDPDCQIRIESLAVAPRHVEIVTEEEASRVIALDSGFAASVNDVVIEETNLNHGDAIRIGKHVLSFASDGVALASRPASDPKIEPKLKRQPAYIQILSGEHIGRIIPLSRNMIRLGKPGGDCAIIVHRKGGYYLSHLEGAHPSVNDMPIGEESVVLDQGSIIRLGGTKLQFYLQQPNKL